MISPCMTFDFAQVMTTENGVAALLQLRLRFNAASEDLRWTIRTACESVCSIHKAVSFISLTHRRPRGLLISLYRWDC